MVTKNIQRIGKIYCCQVGSGDCFKIGRTMNSPEDRKRGFATGSPVKLSLYKEVETEYASELERYIHVFLDEKRAENGEFFHVSSHELDEAITHAVAVIEESQPIVCQAASFRMQSQLSATYVEPPTGMFQIYSELRRLRRELFFLEQQKIFLESKIQIAIGDNCGMRNIASWKWRDRWIMDMDRFKEDALYQQLFQQYKYNAGSRTFSLERTDLAKAA